VSRLCQFLLAAAFWIGRIDSQFLSDDVEAFGYHFDTVPQKYFTEILVHEGHRHPFIERLSAMYLMRLKHGEYFGTDAGAQWRIVFVLTLMPWLVKFSQGREHGGDEGDDSDEESADDVNADWELGDSNASAAKGDGDRVKLTGNIPWNPSDESVSSVTSGDGDGENGRQSRNASWNQYASAKSFGRKKGNDMGRSRRTSWQQYVSAKSFGSSNGDSVSNSGRSASWKQFASARSVGDE